MSNIELEQIVNSSLWAAYGDALGFITELADVKTLKMRTGLTYIDSLVDWKRNIGGKYGTQIKLPAGAYSDDTQLRLSTSRSIRKDGHFAVNSFAKIEIPTWQNYALGAGRGSKVAASNLSKSNSSWLNNFYKKGDISYVNGGGNGAAMRIQPHVWSSSNIENVESYILDVIRNSIITHGHPRAIAGAVFHSLTLAYALINKAPPDIHDLRVYNRWTLKIPGLLRKDSNLATIWINQYENLTGTNISQEYTIVYDEINSLIDLVEEWLSSESPTYSNLVSKLDLKNEKIRGSGTLTSVASSAAAILVYKKPIEELFSDIVNELHTDTDTIATMVGAIIGSFVGVQPPQQLQDEDYIIQEACRLFSIMNNNAESEYDYPDVLNWKNPTSIADYIQEDNSSIYFQPFGELKLTSEEYLSRSKGSNFCHQWGVSTLGQSFLIKKRLNKAPENTKNMQSSFKYDSVKPSKYDSVTAIEKEAPPKPIKPSCDLKDINIDELVSIAQNSNLNYETIGQHIVAIANSNLGTNGVVAYSSIISKLVKLNTSK